MGRQVEKIVIIHASHLSQVHVRQLVDWVTKTADLDTTAATPVQVKDYSGGDPGHDVLDRQFGMMVLIMMEKEGELTEGASSRAWVGECGVDGRPTVTIVVYKAA
jgi:hypothetical protein